MKTQITLLMLAITLIPGGSWAASSCSRANLTRCLDSACAINISSNPSARCQYCGTPSAGSPSSDGIRSVSVGSSTKYNITDKELKSAPTEPSKRYAWAAKRCIERVSGCTVEDVSDVYDDLITQSCRAAGIAAEVADLSAQLRETRSETSCSNEITACMISDDNCGRDFAQCKSDTDFDRVFSNCTVLATGCDEFSSNLRDKLFASRNDAVERAENALASIIKSYQTARENRIANTRKMCENKTGMNNCVETVCNNNMNNRCADGFDQERAMATLLCKFYDIACATLK